MAFSESLSNRVREYLSVHCDLPIHEKGMFAGWAFLVDGKMCINISGDRLMCRFDPDDTENLLERRGVEPMVMRAKQLQGYALVNPEGYRNEQDFVFWMKICLEYNPKAKSSKTKKE